MQDTGVVREVWMPRGVWISHAKQIEHAREMGKAPKTPKQLEASRVNARIAGKIACRLPRTPRQLEGRIFGNDIIKHHNDLCHGAERPDDVTSMTSSEHIRLHAKLRCQNRERDSKGRFK